MVGTTTKGRAPKERRRARRIDCELWAVWLKRSGNIEAAVADVSDRGLFVRSTELPRVGELGRLEVFLPNDPAPVALSVVVRSLRRTGARVGFGVELHAVDEKASQRWATFYASLGRQQPRSGGQR